MRQRAIYGALWLVSWIVSLFPLRAREAFGSALGYLAGSVLRIRRRVVEEAMTHAGIDSPASSADAMYRQLGRGLVDLLFLAGADENERRADLARVTIDDTAKAALDAALARGPVILFASHTGNWEIAAAAAGRLLQERGRRIAVVAKPMSARGVDGFLARLRARLGVDIVAPEGALAAARRELAAGNVIVMPIDQVPDRSQHALRVPYLGEVAYADRAPATLAWRASATALVVAAQYTPGGSRVLVLDVISPRSDSEISRTWIDQTTRRATRALERFVRKSPAAWLWLHRRWRAPRGRKMDGSPVLSGMRQRQ